jgi:hypothetical protein
MEASDRTKLTASAIADALFGLQGFTSDVPEVQELVGEIAKKIAVTAAELNSEQLGRALFGLQGEGGGRGDEGKKKGMNELR